MSSIGLPVRGRGMDGGGGVSVGVDVVVFCGIEKIRKAQKYISVYSIGGAIAEL